MRTDRSVQLYALSALLAMDDTTRALNVRHLSLLALMCDAARPFSISEIADVQVVSRSFASRLVDRLHEHGLVLRVENAANRTMVTVTATAKGRALHERVQRFLSTAAVATTPAIQQAS
jgi:DNA-binding MarR family transcriptional regulator